MKEVRHVTKAEVIDYLESTIRLKLWFVWNWLDGHPGESFDSVIAKRVDLYRRTSFHPIHLDGPMQSGHPCAEWTPIVETLKGIYELARAQGDVEDFEREGMELLRPFAEARADRDVEDLKAGKDTANYQCGSLRYNLAPNGDNPQRIGFHIANARHPGSPFDDKLYFPYCFMVLMSQCEAKFGVTEIGTCTWLNSHPRWLALFPKQWHDNMGEELSDILWNYGFWGQFLTARKTFNHKLGEQFRRTGKMPYLPKASWCSIEEMRRHLRDSFGLPA